MIHAIILAAGRSSRMGEQKLLMPFRGAPMADAVIKAALSCGFDGTSVVVSRETLELLSLMDGADYIVNPDPDKGQDSSFRLGLAALNPDSDFAVFLGDKPQITAERVIELRRCFELALRAGKSALVPRRDGAPGHPAFYSSVWRERFLSGKAGARATLFEHQQEAEWADFCHSSFFSDVDTPEDYRLLIKSERKI